MAGMKKEYNPNRVNQRKRRPVIYIICEGEETEINLDTFVSGFYSISLNEQLADLEINGEEFDFNSLFGLGNKSDEE